MSASLTEVRQQADVLMALLGARIRSGRLILHFDDFQVQRVETSIVHRPKHGDVTVDKREDVGAD